MPYPALLSHMPNRNAQSSIAVFCTLGLALFSWVPVYAQCTDWEPVGDRIGLSGRVYELKEWDPDGPGPLSAQLIAAGNSLMIRNGNQLTLAGSVAAWDGIRWRSLSTAQGVVRALEIDNDGSLVVAGNFTMVGLAGSQIQANSVARWDGTQWSSLGSGLPNLPVWDVLKDNEGRLIAVGMISNNEPFHTHVSRWDGQNWISVGMPQDFGPVYAKAGTLDPQGRLIVGGHQSVNPFAAALRVDAIWVPIYSTFDDFRSISRLMTAQDGSVYAAETIGLTRWDGTTWSVLPSIGGTINAIAESHDGNLIACGFFSINGQAGFVNVAERVGVEWQSIGFNPISRIDAMCIRRNGEIFVASSEGGIGNSIVSTRRTRTADLGSPGGVTQPDGILDANDFYAFIQYFFDANPIADFGRNGGRRGADGDFDNNDFIVFVEAYFAGC